MNGSLWTTPRIVYTRPDGGPWDAGQAGPPGATRPVGLGVLPNGSIVWPTVGTDQVYILSTDGANASPDRAGARALDRRALGEPLVE